MSRLRRQRSPVLLLGILFLVTLVGACRDDEIPGIFGPFPPSPPATVGRLRAALLSGDVQSVDVAVNGRVLFGGLSYPTVSTYAQLESGEYRVQFLRAGEDSPALAETVLTLGTGQAGEPSRCSYPSRFEQEIIIAVEEGPAKILHSAQSCRTLVTYAAIRRAT